MEPTQSSCLNTCQKLHSSNRSRERCVSRCQRNNQTALSSASQSKQRVPLLNQNSVPNVDGILVPANPSNVILPPPSMPSTMNHANHMGNKSHKHHNHHNHHKHR